MNPQTWFDFLERMWKPDADWLLEIGGESMISGGERLIEKDKPAPNLYFILRGLFRVAIGDLGSTSCCPAGRRKKGCR